jgi:tRNA G37 N-methylase TrmD
MKVPDILLSGHHAQIDAWRKSQTRDGGQWSIINWEFRWELIIKHNVFFICSSSIERL